MTIKELYEYARENELEEKQLTMVRFENGCVFVDDGLVKGIKEIELHDNSEMLEVVRAMTNVEYIKTASLEEVAIFLSKNFLVDCEECPADELCCGFLKCQFGLKKWLESEVEVDE